MKSIKGKVLFILSLSLLSLAILIIFSIYFFNQQAKLANEIQEVQTAFVESEDLKYKMLNTRYQEQLFLSTPSEQQAQALTTSIESVNTFALQYAEENKQYEDISASFQAIAESTEAYSDQLVSVVGMYNVMGFTEEEGQRKSLNDTYENIYSSVVETENEYLINLLLDMRLNETKYINTNNSVNLTKFNDLLKEFTKSLSEQNLSEEEARKLNSDVLGYKMTMTSIRSGLTSAQQIVNDFSTISSEVESKVREVNLAAEELSKQMTEEQKATQQVISTLLIVIGLVALLIIVVTGFILNRSISKSIQNLKKGAERMGSGDLSYRVEIKGKDEMSELAVSFNKMADKMHQSLLKVLEASKVLGDSSGKLTAIAQQTSVQTTEVSEAINQVAIGSQEQASQIDESTNLIDLVTVAIQRTEKANEEIVKALQNAEKDSQSGIEKVYGLEKISSSFIQLAKHLSDEVNQATEQSKKINNIVSTIQEIADSTNLLALNAAIESARAGEHGRGFAVVADEVRKLAERSKQEAEEIYQLISNMTNQMNFLSKEAEKFNLYQKEQSKSVEETKDAFTSITEQVYNMNDKMKGAQTSVSEISNANEDLKRKIHEISIISEQAVATAEEVAASSENQTESIEQLSGAAQNLHALSQELEAEVNEFKLDEEEELESTEEMMVDYDEEIVDHVDDVEDYQEEKFIADEEAASALEENQDGTKDK
ncbi:methyl-accepting chemotaxis protein [Salirhabdus euzebyi]|uniref:Methyl-accepting chemotaxis protein n=1 Tax=Salirhabdus euzebyi TaxID=394506 RepID=A0A841Q1R4_9BACI|nr:methyl-accepting chemotaxis protein [Salirhabdus euzebyi]MBB6452152.1 methyl-accepting chemotaxis protein [Salirhabdus euzebyi]